MWHHRREKIFSKLGARGADEADLRQAPNGEKKLPDDHFALGVLAIFTGSTRRVLIEEAYGMVLAAGREISQEKSRPASRPVTEAARAPRRR